MIKHFAADGTVKREWPDGLHATVFECDGKQFASVAKSNAVETVELADGEQVGETFVAAIASELVAADVHPIESALAAVPASVDVHQVEDVQNWARSITGADPNPLPPVAIAPDPVISFRPNPTSGNAGPIPISSNQIVIQTELGSIVQPAEFASLPARPIEIKTVSGSATTTFNALTSPDAAIPILTAGSVTEHHVPSPAEVVETAAHALSDAAAVLKQEEARNASSAIAQSVEPQEAQATHSTEAVQIPTSEASHG